jgi:hypothetical protein
MHTSSELALPSRPVPAARRTGSSAVIRALVRAVQMAGAAVTYRVLAGSRRRRAWREDLPSNVGMDQLAKQAYHPWILRP